MLRRSSLSLLAAVVLAALSTASAVQAADLRVTFAELTRLIQVIAGGAKVHLNNTPELLSTASYASITPTQQYPLDVPVKSFTVLGSTYGYFVSSVNSTSVRVISVPGALRLAIAFESEGPEAVARCLSGSCQLEAALPDIEWNDAAINVDFVPIRLGDSISLQVKTVSMGGTPRAVCKPNAGVLSATACTVGRPFANRTISNLKTELPKILKDQVNQPGIQKQFADGLRRYLSLGQAGDVMIGSISVDPKSMTVNFRLPGAVGNGN